MIAFYEPELVPDLPPAQDTWAQKFAAYHAANPDVLDIIYERALSLLPASYLGMRRIVEDLRAEKKIPPVNNNFIPFYNDAILAKDARFVGILRQRASAGVRMIKVPKRKKVYAR